MAEWEKNTKTNHLVGKIPENEKSDRTTPLKGMVVCGQMRTNLTTCAMQILPAHRLTAHPGFSPRTCKESITE